MATRSPAVHGLALTGCDGAHWLDARRHAPQVGACVIVCTCIVLRWLFAVSVRCVIRRERCVSHPIALYPVYLTCASTVDPQRGIPPDSTPRCSEVAVRRARTLAHVPHASLRVRDAPLARWTQGCLYVSRPAAQGWGPPPSPVDVPPLGAVGGTRAHLVPHGTGRVTPDSTW